MFVIKDDAFSSFIVFFYIYRQRVKKVTNQVTYRGSQWLVNKEVILDMLSAMKRWAALIILYKSRYQKWDQHIFVLLLNSWEMH